MTEDERIIGLLAANNDLVEARRAAEADLAVQKAIVQALGTALLEAKQRRAAAEAAAEQARDHAARMLPLRIEAERQRDAAHALALEFAAVFDGYEAHHRAKGTPEADAKAEANRVHAARARAAAGAGIVQQEPPVTTNG